MNPWLIFWAPQLHFPFGGSVAQRIEPKASWFFDSIASSAGDGVIERKAFEVASYGRQLGLITELLLDMAEQWPPQTAAGEAAMKRLQQIRADIENLKEQDADALVRDIESKVARLKQKHKTKTATLRRKLNALTDDDA
jgi:hypothetical protein